MNDDFEKKKDVENPETTEEKLEISEEGTEISEETIVTASETVETVDDVLEELKTLQKRHDMVDEIFEEPDDGEPIRQWTMADINNLIYGAEQKADIEKQSPDFDFDKYQEYITPDEEESDDREAIELTGYNDTSAKDEYEKTLDEKAVYISKNYTEDSDEEESDIVSDDESVQEAEFEDVYSSSEENVESEEKFEDISSLSEREMDTADNAVEETQTEDKPEDNLEDSAIENSAEWAEIEEDAAEKFTIVEEEPQENEVLLSDQEFAPLDEDEIAQVEDTPQEEFEPKDYLKIKDIFRNSKFFQKRREKRAQVKKSAFENVKSIFGSDVIDKESNDSEFAPLDEDDAKKFEEIKEAGDVTEDIEQSAREEAEKEFIENETDGIFTQEKNELLNNVEIFDDVDDTYFENDQAPEEVYVETKDEGPDIIVENEDEVSEDFYEVIEKSEEEKQRELEELERQNPKSEEDKLFENVAEEQEDIPFETFINSFAGKNLVEEISQIGAEAEEKSDDDNLLFSSQEKKRRFKLTNIPEDYNDFDTNYFSPEKGRYDEEEYLELKDENNPKSIASVFKKSLSPNQPKKLKEYRSLKEKPQMMRELSEKRRHSIFSFIAIVLLSVLLWIIMALPIVQQFASSVSAESGLMNGVSLLVLIMAFIVSSKITQSGLNGLLRGKINQDTGITVALIAAVINSVLFFFDLIEVANTLPIYSSAIMFGLLMTSFGHALQDSRALKCFKAITSNEKTGIYVVQNIEDKTVADNIARIVSKRGKNIKYSAKAAFPARFLYNSFSNDFSDRMSRRFFPIASVVSILIAIIAGFVNKSILNAFTVLTASLCISIPVSQIIAIDLPLLLANGKLAKASSGIVGHSAIAQAGKTNAIVVKSTDIYDSRKCVFHGLHEFGNTKVDDIIRYAAAMLIHSKGPLSHAFDNVFIGEQAKMLPRVENLQYEERLGLNGKIYGQRILVGNRKLLLKYDLDAPEKGAETKCRNEGKKLLYIAIDNIVAAMLIVQYSPSEDARELLSKFEKNHVSIVVTTNDCNIDEETISLDFNIGREIVRVIGDYEGSLLQNYENVQKEAVPAKLIHNGTARGYLGCMTSAISLNNSMKLLSIIQLLFVFVGFLMTMIFAFSGNLSTFNSTFIVIYQAICSLIAIASSLIRYKS